MKIMHGLQEWPFPRRLYRVGGQTQVTGRDKTFLDMPVMLDETEAALVLRSTTAAVRRLIVGGELAAVKVAGEYRINADSLQAFANRGLREQLQAQLRALDRLDASLPRL